MNDDRPILDLEIAARDKKFATYWNIEIKLIYAVYIVQALCIVGFLIAFLGEKSIIFLSVIVGGLSHVALGCWQLLNGIVFAFLDKANKTMRYKYILYAFSTLALIIPSAFLAEYCDRFVGGVSWILCLLVNIVILPHLVSYYYIQTLKKSIA